MIFEDLDDDLEILKPEHSPFYQKALEFYLSKMLSEKDQADLAKEGWSRGKFSIEELVHALILLRIEPDEHEVYFLGVLLLYLDVPPFWRLEVELEAKSIFFRYRVKLLVIFTGAASPPNLSLYNQAQV